MCGMYSFQFSVGLDHDGFFNVILVDKFFFTCRTALGRCSRIVRCFLRPVINNDQSACTQVLLMARFDNPFAKSEYAQLPTPLSGDATSCPHDRHIIKLAIGGTVVRSCEKSVDNLYVAVGSQRPVCSVRTQSLSRSTLCGAESRSCTLPDPPIISLLPNSILGYQRRITRAFGW